MIRVALNNIPATQPSQVSNPEKRQAADPLSNKIPNGLNIPSPTGFLREIWQLDNAKGFEKAYFRHNDRNISLPIGDFPEKIPNVYADFFRPEPVKDFGDWYFSPQLYRRNRTSENIVQLNALALDFDSIPLAKIKYDLPVKPHYIVRTRFLEDHFHAIFKIDSLRLGKKNRSKILKWANRILEKLAEATGADPNAASVNQLFRLPWAPRKVENGVYTLEIIEKNDIENYKLKDLSKKPEKTTTFKGYKTAERNQNILDAPPIKFIHNNTVLEGSRNTALVALCYADAMAGFSYKEALPKLHNWRKNHTSPTYPKAEADRVIKSCFKNPKGLRHEKLMTINTLEKGAMPERLAKSIYKDMNTVRQEHRLQDEIKNIPQAVAVLKTLVELAKIARTRRIRLTAKQLGDLTNLGKDRIDKQVNPVLERLEVKAPNSRPNLYYLNHIPQDLPTIRYDCSIRLENDYAPSQVWWYINLRAPGLYRQLIDALNGREGHRQPNNPALNPSNKPVGAAAEPPRLRPRAPP